MVLGNLRTFANDVHVRHTYNSDVDGDSISDTMTRIECLHELRCRGTPQCLQPMRCTMRAIGGEYYGY